MPGKTEKTQELKTPAAQTPAEVKKDIPQQPEGEINGPQGPEPTRYGDWEIGGRCSDF